MTPVIMTRYDWYQNDNTVIIIIYEKNLKKEDLSVQLDENVRFI